MPRCSMVVAVKLIEGKCMYKKDKKTTGMYAVVMRVIKWAQWSADRVTKR